MVKPKIYNVSVNNFSVQIIRIEAGFVDNIQNIIYSIKIPFVLNSKDPSYDQNSCDQLIDELSNLLKQNNDYNNHLDIKFEKI